MLKIEESENFHPRRKMTSSLKMAAFLEENLLPKTPYVKVRKVYWNVRELTAKISNSIKTSKQCQ